MDFKKFRVGYVPISRQLNLPGDTLRFCHFASIRGIRFEVADPTKDYDFVVVSDRGDKSIWSEYRRSNAKIIYDLVDSYLAIPWYDLKGVFRGLAKYVSGESRYLKLNYWKSIQDMCKRADAVICGSEEQKADIIKFCKNVHVILDFTNRLSHTVKKDYSSRGEFNLVWAGLPCNITTLFEIKDVLEKLKMKYEVALHIVTNLQYYKYMGKYGHRDVASIMKRLFDKVYLYEWSDQSCSSIITACDLAFIPIPLSDPFAAGKPENKLLLFWRMGMPVVVSATPAYTRAMQRCGLPMACQTKSEWLEVLEKYMGDEEARRQAGERGRIFAESHYSEDKISACWDEVFRSIM